MSISEQINKQARYLLANPAIAWLMTGVFALFSFTGWVSLAIMALVTLRLAWFDGIRCLIIGLTVSICVAEVAGQLPDALSTTAPIYLVCYGCAYLLRKLASWQWVGLVGVLFCVLVVLGVHCFATSFLMAEYHAILNMISAIDPDHLIVQSMVKQSTDNQLQFAHYLFGIKMVSVLVSVMIPLLWARSIQSALYYPGAFKEEMMHFRASRIGFGLLVLAAAGVYQHNLLAIGCLPVLFAYLMAAGISLILNVLAKKRSVVIYAVLFLPIIILPYVVLPVYVLFGAVDSLFNLRLKMRIGV